jgi:putative membrane protein
VRPSTLLDPADRQRIEGALFEAHKTTRGEIVVVVLRASDAYTGARWQLGLLLAVIASFGLAAFAPDASPASLLALQALAFVTGQALARIDEVRRRLISQRSAELCVERRAAQAFAESGLRRQPERASVLFFVSLLEHRVLVLADTGIEESMQPSEPWQDLLEPIVDGISAGRAAEGLVEGIERCAALLSVHFPAASDRDGVLPHLVLED